MAAGDDEVGAGLREGASEILAEAAAGAGHNGDAAGEIEEVVNHGSEVIEVWSWSDLMGVYS